MTKVDVVTLEGSTGTCALEVPPGGQDPNNFTFEVQDPLIWRVPRCWCCSCQCFDCCRWLLALVVVTGGVVVVVAEVVEAV